VKRVGRQLQILGDRLQDLLRRVPEPALDLRQVGVRDPDEIGQLAHGELLQLALAADELAEGRRHLRGHRSARGGSSDRHTG
jgi:hypothetical protein